MGKYFKKFLAACTAIALIIVQGGIACPVADAAAKTTVKLNKSSVSVIMGETAALKVVKKNVASVKKIQWTSKDKKVATVSAKGIVKGIKKGSTVVNATVKYKAKGASKFTSKKLSCKVTVKGQQYVDTETPAPTAEPVI